MRPPAPLPPLLLRLLPPVLLAGLGTAQLLRDHGLWYDELYTVAVVDRPIADVVDLVADGRGPAPWLDVPPSFNGPYYVVAALWTRLPLVDADAAGLRSLSLLAAVAAVAVLARAVSLLAGERVAVAAGLCAATAPLLLTQAVEARPYGLALLATALALLGVVRWVRGGGLWLFGVAGTAMSLLHWFALPALAGLALGAFLSGRSERVRGQSGRRWAPMAVAAVASLPALGLVGLAVARDAEGGGYLEPTGLLVPWQALLAWTGADLPGTRALLGLPLLVLTVVAAALGARAAGRAPLWWAWLAVPVGTVTAVDLVRPVFVPRYLLPGLVALAVLAAVGASRRTWVVVVLVVAGLVADAGVLTRARWERADLVAAFLLAEQRPGEPVVAVEGRSAVGLAHYAASTRLGADLRLPPEDPPAGATRVWLVRQLREDGSLRPSDDDQLLTSTGLRVLRTELFRAVKTDLVVQLWGS